MKLEQVKPLFEDSSTINLRNKTEVDQLAKNLHDRHFPEVFHVTVKTSEGNVSMRFELTEKRINDQKNYHTLTFIYERDSRTNSKISGMLSKAEHDEDKYDALSDELEISTIEIHAELGKHIDKVYAHAS